MLRNLATSLINSREERIVTTLPKAKELRPFVERAITLSRRARSLSDGDAQALHLRRQAAGFFHAGNTTVSETLGKRGQPRPERTAGVAALRRLFTELGDRYLDRPGGYTRIFRLGHRDGDNAELAIIELVGNPREVEATEAAKKRKTAASKKRKAGREKETKDEAAGETKAEATDE
jgi:large subunit ribosomal protein L17